MDDKMELLVKMNKELSYEVHHKKQLLTKLLAHLVAVDLAEDRAMAFGELTFEKSRDAFISALNIHIAKVHFTQAEIEYIKNIIDESKKFI